MERPDAEVGVCAVSAGASGLVWGTWLSLFQQKRATSSLKLVRFEGRMNSSSGVASSEEGERVVEEDNADEE